MATRPKRDQRVIGGPIRLVPTSELILHPQNPRQGDVGAVHQSIEANGFYGCLIVQESTGHVLAGNHRLLAARAAGIDALPVQYVSVDDDRALRIMLADNRSSDLAAYDDHALADLLQLLAGSDDGLDGALYDSDDLDVLLRTLDADLPSAPVTDPAPTVPAEALKRWKVKPGDVWRADRQMIVSGDGTEPSIWNALQVEVGDGDLIWTDPPYGVSYQINMTPAQAKVLHRRSDGLELRNDQMTPDQLQTLFRDAMVASPLRPGGIMYVAAPPGPLLREFMDVLVGMGWLRQCLVWAKDTFVFGRSDYHYRHEMLLYGWKPGAAHYFTGDRTLDTVWLHPRPSHSPEHPTMKPVELVARAIRNSSRAGDVVLDPFAGSGTTLLACHHLGRQGRAIELDPAYVAVALDRLAALGLEPERLP